MNIDLLVLLVKEFLDIQLIMLVQTELSPLKWHFFPFLFFEGYSF